MTDRTHPDSGRIITSSDVIADLHARIAELESELEAVGAGGVSGPLMGIAAPPTAQAEGWIRVDERLPGEQGPADGDSK